MHHHRHYKLQQHLFLHCFALIHSVNNDSNPEQPRGCPKDTATTTFTLLLSSRPKILELAKPTTANASLNSK
jgi:hypothetical protein